MPPKRERYNASARSSTAGGRTHKGKTARRNRSSIGDVQTGLDTNAPTLDSADVESERALQAQRREALLGASAATLSGKKRKRLDAFIAKGLAKERKVELLKKLAQSSGEVEDRAQLLSAATLGTGRAKSGKERLDGEEKKLERKRERRLGLLRERTGAGAGMSSDEDLDADLDVDHYGFERDSPEGEQLEDPERRARIQAAAAKFAKPPAVLVIMVPSNVTVGSALAKDKDGNPVVPVMRQRQRKRAKKSAPAPPPEESDFDSSESEDDSPDPEAPGAPSSSADEASADLLPHRSKGKHRATSQDRADELLRAAMKARGVAWPSAEDAEGDSEDSDDDGESEDGDMNDEQWYAEIDKGGEVESDEEEDAIFREAMRARGMWVPEMDAEHAERESGAEQSGSTAFATTPEDTPASAQDEEMAELPYFGFASEDDIPKLSATDAASSDEDAASSDDDDASSSSSSSPSTPRARTRQTRKNNVARASGFKDWANAAVGLGGGADSTRDQEGSAHDGLAYKGPTPVAGLTQRVGDLGPQDGIARGPLGGPSKEVLTPFSAKYFEESKANAEKERVRHVNVTRKEDVQEARLKLPVLAEEDLITRTILENPVTVLCGETGSGKTTQVPQFLYEAGFGSHGSDNPGMIGITQPRRVAALSMATRVGAELCLPSTRVSHQIRYDATVSPNTAIKFMTDGVLLRELAGDFLLSRYSAVLVDEAHERSTNTDVLIGVLSRVVKLRAQRWIDGVAGARPLRLIIMSATLRVADFAENTTLFPTPPPIININARQHPVTLHFARKTKHDYVDEATKKAVKIHARLPPGGILIFLTGQQEIATVCKRLEGRFGVKAIEQRKRDRARHGAAAKARRASPEAEAEAGERITLGARDGDVETEELELGGGGAEEVDLAIDVDEADLADEDPDALDTDDEAVPADHDADLPDHLKDDSDVPLHLLPLYSLLPSDKQLRVFAEPPEGTRLCVVATNVAETSLTIPGITYVIDCGRAKERSYDSVSGVQSFNVQWISKASAQQRAGRAGRTGPGHCYRLYSSAIFEDTLPQFAVPEIVRMPVEGLVLQMHAMHLDSVANFPFPTPPDRDALRRAERMLMRLGALELADATGASNKRIQAARVTELGRAMSLFPLAPRFAKLLVQGQQFGCLPYVIALVSALSVGDPFIREQALVEEEDDAEVTDALAKGMHNAEARAKEERKAKNRLYNEAKRAFSALGDGVSDTFRLLAAVGAYEYEKGGSAFCEQNFLRPKAMEEIHKLRAQLSNIVQSRVTPGTDVAALANPQLPPPSDKQLKVLRQLLASAYVDQVAVRADLVPKSASAISSLATGRFTKAQLEGQKPRNWREAVYLVRSSPTAPVFIHPGSVLCSAKSPPEWLVYDTLQTSASGKIWMKTCTSIHPAWLRDLAKPLCSFSKPAEPKIGAAAVVEAAKELKRTGQATTREVVLVPTYGTGPACEPIERNAGPGWDLPPFKTTQTLVGGKWVTQLP